MGRVALTGSEFFGNVVEVVESISLSHACSVGVLGGKGLTDDVWVFEHELLYCGATTRLGIGVLVDLLEDRMPGTSLSAGIVAG